MEILGKLSKKELARIGLSFTTLAFCYCGRVYTPEQTSEIQNQPTPLSDYDPYGVNDYNQPSDNDGIAGIEESTGQIPDLKVQTTWLNRTGSTIDNEVASQIYTQLETLPDRMTTFDFSGITEGTVRGQLRFIQADSRLVAISMDFDPLVAGQVTSTHKFNSIPGTLPIFFSQVILPMQIQASAPKMQEQGFIKFMQESVDGSLGTEACHSVLSITSPDQPILSRKLQESFCNSWGNAIFMRAYGYNYEDYSQRLFDIDMYIPRLGFVKGQILPKEEYLMLPDSSVMFWEKI